MSEWDRVLTNVTVQGDLVIPDGQRWLIGSNVRVEGNVRTDGGVIAMRPGSTLQFIGASRDQYVGGGMTFSPAVSKDYGIWVGGSGALDVSCTPKAGWNRTGVDPSWLPGDELWITPTATGDFQPRRWKPGEAIPRADQSLPAPEIANVTRDCTIEGPGHIFIYSSRPQRIEYVTLRRMGIARSESSGGLTTGRYALHFHHARDGSRGSVVRGVAAINSEGRVYVPHASHGITFEDNVSVNSFGEGFWWDHGDYSHEITVDRLLVTGTFFPREVSNASSYVVGVVLGEGRRTVMRNSVSAGNFGSTESHGFHWEPGTEHRGQSDVWAFEDNVAHNNSGANLRFWTNTADPHLVERFTAYRAGDFGLITGAYASMIRYRDLRLFEDNLLQHSSSVSVGSTAAGYERLTIESRDGPALLTGAMRLPGTARTQWVDCDLKPAPGYPKVLVQAGENPFLASFRRCGLTPEDFQFVPRLPDSMAGSSILIEHEDGRTWRMSLDDQNLPSWELLSPPQ